MSLSCLIAQVGLERDPLHLAAVNPRIQVTVIMKVIRVDDHFLFLQVDAPMGLTSAAVQLPVYMHTSTFFIEQYAL